MTVTVTDWSGEVPPGPVHWKVKVVLEVRGSERPLPESVPELLQEPPAVQLVITPEELQVMVSRLLYGAGFGVTESEAVGAFAVKAAAIVWLAVTFENVYDVGAPWFTPSTVTEDTEYPDDGVMVNVLLAPRFTETAPEGVMVPFAPAEAVMVYVAITHELELWVQVPLLQL